jgi:hypothetical protein
MLWPQALILTPPSPRLHSPDLFLQTARTLKVILDYTELRLELT